MSASTACGTKNFVVGESAVAQWDVYPNPSVRSRGELPFFVDLQSDLLSALETRFVAPLARNRLPIKGLPRSLCPIFVIEGDEVALIAQEAGPVNARQLKHPVASLRSEAHSITSALDAVISGI